MSRTGSYRSSRSINKRRQYSNKYNNDNDKYEKKESISKNNKKKHNKFAKKSTDKTLKTKKVVNKRELAEKDIIFTKKNNSNTLITIGLLVKFNIFGRLCKNSRIILTNILRKNMTFLTYNMEYFVNKHKKGNVSGKDVERFVKRLKKRDLIYGKYKYRKKNFWLRPFYETNLEREMFVIEKKVIENFKTRCYYQLHINLEKLLTKYIYYQVKKYSKYPNYINLKTCCDSKCDHKSLKFSRPILEEYGLISINLFDWLDTFDSFQRSHIVPTYCLSTYKDRLNSYRIAFNGKHNIDDKLFVGCVERGNGVEKMLCIKDNSFKTINIYDYEHPYKLLSICRIPKELASTMVKRDKRII